VGPAPLPPVSERGLKICVASDANGAIQSAAQSVLAVVHTNPLLIALAGSNPPAALTDTKTLMADKPKARAFDHLVVIGLPSDPLVQSVWQREARPEPGGFYIFGFGHLAGDIGYIESDRNPLLHSQLIEKAPYETEVVTITGSTPAGIALAANAFIKYGLVNGVVAAPGWTRPKPNLLERDPLSGDIAAALPDLSKAMHLGDWTLIGLTQGAEDEYRGVLADTGVEPKSIWRLKYYKPGVWDGVGQESSMADYAAGLHRRAYVNTIWLAKFASPAEAAEAGNKIGGAAHLRRSRTAVWNGNLPPYGFEKTTPGPLSLWVAGDTVVMSSVPDITGPF